MVPGTNMTFAGIPRGKERADVIAFLNTKSDKPERAAEAGRRSAAAETAGGSPAGGDAEAGSRRHAGKRPSRTDPAALRSAKPQ